MTVATLPQHVPFPSELMRLGSVMPLEVSTGEGPAVLHTSVGDAFLRTRRPVATGRQHEKSVRVPRNPQGPAHVSLMEPTTYTSGSRTFALPPCSLEGTHASSAVGHGHISVHAAFSGATLFITGASGYIGSVVLEQLLRSCPDVARIYLLIRGKRGSTGEQRLGTLLGRPLFHLHRQSGEFPAEVRRKLVVMTGDLGLPALGLTAQDRATLCREVHYVIHSAASISFVDHIHRLLAHNYTATRNLAELACQMRHIRSFMHVSTAYVNCFLGRGAHVEEQLYPILLDGRRLAHAEVAAELAGMAPDVAERKALEYLSRTRHANTYTFTKWMTEEVLSEFHGRAFPVAIVRPSIVGAIAKHPYPGYFGNSAGPTAYFLAFGSGIATMTCHRPHNVFDVVPADVVGSVILATAAAMVQTSWDRRLPLIVHACSSTTCPVTHFQIYRDAVFPFWSANPAKHRFTLAYQRYDDRGMNSFYLREDTWAFALRQWAGGLKFWLAQALIRALGYPAVARKVWAGWLAWKTYNTPKLDFQLFFCSRNSRALSRLLAPEEAAQIPLVWQAEKGSDHASYFLTHLKYMDQYFFGGSKAKAA